MRKKKMETKQLMGWQRLIRFLFAPSVQVGGVRGGSGLIDEPRPRHLQVVREAAEAAAPGAQATPWAAFQNDHWGGLNTLNPASGLPMVGLVDVAGNPYGSNRSTSF